MNHMREAGGPRVHRGIIGKSEPEAMKKVKEAGIGHDELF